MFFLLVPGPRGASLTPDKQITIVNQDQTDPLWKQRWDAARILSQQDEFEAAIKKYLQVIEEKPHIEEVRWELSKSYIAVRDFPEALVLLEGLIEAAPEKIDYLVSGGDVALAMGRADQASKLFGRALALDPGGLLSEKALFGMIDSLEAQGKHDLTIPLMEQLYQRGLISLELITELARYYDAAGDSARSAHFFQELLTKFSVTPEIQLEAATVFERSGLSAEAAEQWEAHLKSKPDHFQTRIKLADYYYERGDARKALPHMLELLENGILREQYLLDVAKIYLYTLGRSDQALNFYEQYQAEFPQGIDVSSEIATLQLMLANDLLAIVENDGVWMLWRDLDRVTPNRIGIYRAMADMLEEMGRAKEGELIEVLQIINVQEPGDFEIVSRISKLYIHNSKYIECLAFLDRVAENVTDQASFLLLRAQCETGAGLDMERLKSYRAYLKLKKGDESIRSRAVALAGSLGLVEDMRILYENRSQGKSLSSTVLEETYVHGLLQNSLTNEALQYTGTMLEKGLDEKTQVLIYRDLAASYMQQNRLFWAEQVLRKFAARHPYNPDSYLLLSAHYIQRKDPQNASLWLQPLKQDNLNNSGITTLSPEQNSVLFYQDLLLDELNGKAGTKVKATTYLSDRLRANQIIEADVEILLFAARQLLLDSGYDECTRLLADFRLIFKEDVRLDGLLFLAGNEAARGTDLVPTIVNSLSYTTSFAVVDLLIELGRFADAHQLSSALVAEIPPSTRGRAMQARTGELTSHYKEAYQKYTELAQDYPAESWFTEQMLVMENIQGGPDSIFSIFSVKADETGRKNRITNRLESMNYPKAKLMWARALWAEDRWEDALDVYGLLDTELKREIDQLIDVIQKSPELLDEVPASLNETGVVDQIMSTKFLSNNLEDKINTVSADYYDSYRWSKIVDKEMTAKSSFKAREFYQAELDYQILFEEEGVVIEENYPDLATVYGRLGRYKEETELIETIQEKSIFYPSLSQVSEKSIRRQRPFLSIDGLYREEDGRDGYKNITQKYAGLGLRIKPTLYQETGISAGRSEYGNSFASTLAKSNLLVGNYAIELHDNLQGEFRLGFEDFDTDGKSFLIYDATLRGSLEQRVELFGTIKQEPVDDTIDSLLDGIYRKDLQFGFTLDYLFGMFFGFDLSFFDYNDDNEGQRYHLWGSYRWFGDRSSFDFTYSYLNIQNEISNEMYFDLEDAQLNGGPVYWSPGDYWRHRLAAYYKLELWPTGRLQSGTSSLSALYALGFEEDDNLVHELEANILLEISQPFLVKGTFSTLISDDYNNLKGYISLVYRW